MNIERAKHAFQNYLEGKDLTEDNLSLLSFVSIFLGYYREVEFPELDRSKDGDLLLFQYGLYDWGEGRFFEVDFTRQFSEFFPESDDHEIHQQRFTFYFEPERFENTEHFDTWSNDHSDLEGFENVIRASVGYCEAVSRSPIKRSVVIEHVC